MRACFRSGRLARAAGFATVAALTLSVVACGKKGPPLAPLVTLPNRTMDLTAKRLGDTIYVTFTVPTTNIDLKSPADLHEMEVYAYTALTAPEGRELKRLQLIATIPVKAPPEPEEADEAQNAPAPPEEPGVEQGQLIAISEVVNDDLRVRLPPDPKAPKIKPVVVPEPEFALPLGPPPDEPQLARFYVAVGVNRKGKRGALSARGFVRLHDAPAAPDAPLASVTEASIRLAWRRPTALRRPYLDVEAGGRQEVLLFGWFVTLPRPPRLPSTFNGLPPQPVIAYHVYRVPAPGAPQPSEAVPTVPGVVEAPVPLTVAPTVLPTFSDPIVAWGVPQCYAVRTVATDGLWVVQSEPSPVTCVTPRDIFPPAAPANLAAVASEGAISLIWERVTTPDVAGYLVLRGPAPDGPLKSLFEEPIRETTFRDMTAVPGVRYVYEVVAVDRAATPNKSRPSNRVVEAAR